MLRRDFCAAALVGLSLIAGLGALAWLSLPPAIPPPRVQVLYDVTSSRGEAFAAGAVAAARKGDVDLQLEPIEPAEARRPRGLRTRIERAHPDGVVVGPIAGLSDVEQEEFAGLNPSLHIVVCQPAALLHARRLHVGNNDYALGRQGAAVARAIAHQGGATAAVYDPSQGAHQLRLQGFSDAIAAVLPHSNDPPLATAPPIVAAGASVADQLRTALAANAKIACLVCFSAEHSSAAARVLAESPSREITIVALDAIDATFDDLAAGRIDAIVAEHPFDLGYQAVRSTATLCETWPADLPVTGAGTYRVPLQVITRDNLAAFRTRRGPLAG